MKRTLAHLAPLALGFASLAGCAPTSLDVSAQPIVDGTRESGYPAVYYMLRTDGAACTATLISPHVVLTARHCVVNAASTAAASPSIFLVYPGTEPDPFRDPAYRVSRVEIIPGSTSEIGDGQAGDLGILILRDAADETPMDLARDVRARNGSTVTSIGYGVTPSGTSGVKLRTTTSITNVAGGLYFVDPSVCSGDSGGPMLGEDGRIYGVASFIYSADGASEPVCGTAPGAYNEIYRHIDWINEMIASTGDACFPETEVCDGVDNDCNDQIDETCQALGAACTDSATCTGGLCAETTVGSICTQACDPTTPTEGCPDGFFCTASPFSCDGACVPGSVGTAALDASCTTDAECASGVCRDPGDGRTRCLTPCRGDEGDCNDGQVCVGAAGACSVCVDAAELGGARGLGETCAADAECRSGLCVIRAGVGECGSECGAGTVCSDGFSCVDRQCVRQRSVPVGGVCLATTDCVAGAICALQGESGWCTVSCTSSECPAGLTCEDVGGSTICVPSLGLDGASCSSDGECVSGACRALADGSGSVCTRACSETARCAPGFVCEDLADGSLGCVDATPTAPTSSGGCSANVGSGAGSSVAFGAVLAVALGALARRRKR